MGSCCASALTAEEYESHAHRITTSITHTGPRVCILGSKSFHSTIGPALCDACGSEFARRQEEYVLITGGNRNKRGGPETVQERFANAFHASAGAGRGIIHLRASTAKWNEGQWPFGQVIVAGRTGPQRREILARVCHAYVLIEGGDGAAHEAQAVLDAGHVLVPVVCTGGAAAGMFCAPMLAERMRAKPDVVGLDADDWALVTDPYACPTPTVASAAEPVAGGDVDAAVQALASAIVRIVAAVTVGGQVAPTV